MIMNWRVPCFTDQRSDQIIASILATVGFTATQYDLDTGLNTIGFAWFDKGTKAGTAIRQICEAEEGHFFQDEEGLLRFENRRNVLNKTTPTWTINPEDCIEYERDTSTPILNRVTVEASPRTVQPLTEIWELGTVETIQPAEDKQVWANYENPVTNTVSPIGTVDYTVNTLADGTGLDITADMSVGIDKFATSSKLTITNASGGIGYITFFRLRGTPATVTGEISENLQRCRQ